MRKPTTHWGTCAALALGSVLACSPAEDTPNDAASTLPSDAPSTLPNEPRPATTGGTTSSSPAVPATYYTGGASTVGGGVGGTSGVTCKPQAVTGYNYPTYKSPRRRGGRCTEDDLFDYYSQCLYQGSCSDFLTGGSRAACGACLEPTTLASSELGPIVRLDSEPTAISQMNSAGCVDLLGESSCVEGIWTTSVCKYAACSSACSAIGASAVEDAMDGCMAIARASVCAATQPDVSCFGNPNSATRCSGFNFAAQFIAVARVFCVESH